MGHYSDAYECEEDELFQTREANRKSASNEAVKLLDSLRVQANILLNNNYPNSVFILTQVDVLRKLVSQ